MIKKEIQIIVDRLCDNTEELLNNHFAQAETLAIGTDEIKIGIIHSIKKVGKKLNAKSTIGFGRRIKASVEHEIDSDQTEMAFGGNNAPEAKPKALRHAKR